MNIFTITGIVIGCLVVLIIVILLVYRRFKLEGRNNTQPSSGSKPTQQPSDYDKPKQRHAVACKKRKQSPVNLQDSARLPMKTEHHVERKSSSCLKVQSRCDDSDTLNHTSNNPSSLPHTQGDGKIMVEEGSLTEKQMVKGQDLLEKGQPLIEPNIKARSRTGERNIEGPLSEEGPRGGKGPQSEEGPRDGEGPQSEEGPRGGKGPLSEEEPLSEEGPPNEEGTSLEKPNEEGTSLEKPKEEGTPLEQPNVEPGSTTLGKEGSSTPAGFTSPGKVKKRFKRRKQTKKITQSPNKDKRKRAHVSWYNTTSANITALETHLKENFPTLKKIQQNIGAIMQTLTSKIENLNIGFAKNTHFYNIEQRRLLFHTTPVSDVKNQEIDNIAQKNGVYSLVSEMQEIVAQTLTLIHDDQPQQNKVDVSQNWEELCFLVKGFWNHLFIHDKFPNIVKAAESCWIAAPSSFARDSKTLRLFSYVYANVKTIEAYLDKVQTQDALANKRPSFYPSLTTY